MPAVNWATITRNTPKSERVELSDPNLPEPFVIYLRRVGPLVLGDIRSLAETYNAKYITGGWLNEAGDEMPMAASVMVGDEEAKFSWEALFDISLLEKMQEGAPAGEYRHTFTDFVNCAYLLPDLYLELVAKAKRIQWLKPKGENEGKEAAS
jgi:hypothetical protein